MTTAEQIADDIIAGPYHIPFKQRIVDAIEAERADAQHEQTKCGDRLLEIIRQRNTTIHNLKWWNVALRAALLLIGEWKEPYPGFGADNGSNGMRDHFQAIALTTLTNPPHVP